MSAPTIADYPTQTGNLAVVGLRPDGTPSFLKTDADGNMSSGSGLAYTSSVTKTRPSNTTAYTAGDVLGIADAGTPADAGSAILTFANVGPSGGAIFITDSRLEIDVTAIPSGMTSFRLHLYSASPTAILDNAAWDLPAGDRASYLGYVDLGSPADLGSTLFVQATGINKKIKLATGSTSLFAEIVTNGGYTPSSGAVKAVTLETVSA